MSDVDTWSPVDESNTSPPPNGWPEFMLPSAVNNSARAMMGAVRRMYDKQVDGSTVLPYLKLSGGTVTGAVTISGGLTTPNISVSSNITAGGVTANAINASVSVNAASYNIQGSAFATRDASNLIIYDNAGVQAFAAQSGGITYHSNTAHRFYTRSLATHLGTIDATGLSLLVGNLAVSAGNVTASGNVQGNYLKSTGHADVAGSLGVVATLTAATVTASGTVSAATVSGTNVSGTTVNGGTYTGGAFTGSSVNVGGAVSGGSLATAGNASIGGTATVHDVLPSIDNVGICGGSAAAWNVVESYDFITKSDAASKTDLGPLPDTLGLVAAIEPQAFRYGDDPVRHWGFIAQDVRTAIGNLPVDIVRGEEGRLGLDYAGLTAMLWQAVRALAAKVQQLEGSHV